MLVVVSLVYQSLPNGLFYLQELFSWTITDNLADHQHVLDQLDTTSRNLLIFMSDFSTRAEIRVLSVDGSFC